MNIHKHTETHTVYLFSADTRFPKHTQVISANLSLSSVDIFRLASSNNFAIINHSCATEPKVASSNVLLSPTNNSKPNDSSFEIM